MTVESLDFIARLEGKLKAAVNLAKVSDDCWRLSLMLNYDGDPAGTMSFTLNGYSEADALALARDVGSSQFIMREIDDYLWGEMD